MEQFFIIGNQLIEFFSLIALGLLAAKCKVLNETSLSGLSKLIIQVILPILIFISAVTGATRDGLLESLIVLPITAVVYLLLWLLSHLTIRLFHLKGNRAKVMTALLMFGNVGFMGIPLVSQICPKSGMLYIALYTIIDQTLFWTLGVSLTKPADQTARHFELKSLKHLISPALIGILLAFFIVLMGWQLPAVLESTLLSVGNSSMPLSLIYIGGLLYFTDIRPVLRSGALYFGILTKMVVLPVLVYLCLHYLGMAEELQMTITILVALPAISSVAMLTKQNNSDGDYAISAIMLTTIACLVTLPVVSICMSVIK